MAIKTTAAPAVPLVALVHHLRHPVADDRDCHVRETVPADVAADDTGLLPVVVDRRRLDCHAAFLVLDELFEELGEREPRRVGHSLALEVEYQLVALSDGLLLGPRLHRTVGGDQLSRQRLPVAQRNVPLVGVSAASQTSARVLHG